MVLWFYGVVVLWLLGFKNYQKSISCSQEDIDPISKIFDFFETDLHYLSVPVFSKIDENELSDILRFINIILFKMFQGFPFV